MSILKNKEGDYVITIECTTEEYNNLIRAFEGSINCPFESNPKIKCSLNCEEEPIDGEEEASCIPCFKKNIIWIIEDQEAY